MTRVLLTAIAVLAMGGQAEAGVCSPERPCTTRLRASHHMKQWTTPESFAARARVVVDMFVRKQILTLESAPDCGAHYTGQGVSAYGRANCKESAPIRFRYVSFGKPAWLRVIYYRDGTVP